MCSKIIFRGTDRARSVEHKFTSSKARHAPSSVPVPFDLRFIIQEVRDHCSRFNFRDHTVPKTPEKCVIFEFLLLPALIRYALTIFLLGINFPSTWYSNSQVKVQMSITVPSHIETYCSLSQLNLPDTIYYKTDMIIRRIKMFESWGDASTRVQIVFHDEPHYHGPLEPVPTVIPPDQATHKNSHRNQKGGKYLSDKLVREIEGLNNVALGYYRVP
ncbi:hypothetical protein C8Q75DRAFT_736518 [Abortiporus biennis]|nr:hypothetical protein C8Q75DRAFT_736518 [Abortiporus biennis]